MELSGIGVTAQQKAKFNKKGIYTVEDLVRFLPRKYKDFTSETGILPETEVSCFIARVDRVTSGSTKNMKTMIIAHCVILSNHAPLTVTWFNSEFKLPDIMFCVGKNVLVAGKVKYNADYQTYSILVPELFSPNIHDSKRVYPVYSKIQNMSDSYLQSKLETAISIAEATKENIPYEIVSREHLLPMKEALYHLHFPKTLQQVETAKQRLLFDDLLYFALQNEWASRNSAVGSTFSVKTRRALIALKESLPYELTKDQDAAIEAMIQNAQSGKRINALVQGDVGCGKTIIAFFMMIAFADSGYQSVIMAPTQVLARQHYEGLKEVAEPLGFKVVYLGSELKAKEKKAVAKMIESGEANLIVGTHSVIGESVHYKNLALTVADEEHKFGVAQRAALVEKASEGVHSITMSATPIPRSLAQAVYGNRIQLHSIIDKPAGRMRIKTAIRYKSRMDGIFRFITDEAKKGHQTYVVCPMIGQNESMENVQSVESVAQQFKETLEPNGVSVGVLTGRNSKEETAEIIEAFKEGTIQILVATTVVEVGVNIPTATTMIVMNAERFGLSQLHQLRGRVGRSNLQSYCILMSETQTEDGVKRLNAMITASDGFEIAKADLEIRGAGDFLGSRQSGENKALTLMLAYPDVYKKAQQIASEIIDRGMDCQMLRQVEEEDPTQAF